MTEDRQRQIFSSNLRRFIDVSGKTQKEIADAIGVSQQIMNVWARGKAIPRMGKIQKLADFFGIEKSELIDEQTEKPSLPAYSNIVPLNIQRIPLLGEIACGQPIFCTEDRESYVEAGTDVRADFCLKARGDSMVGARILDGDLVFIQRDAELENGQIFAVAIDDEATLKRVYYNAEASMLQLLSENPKYPPMIYSGEQLDHVHILGRAIAFQSDVI